MVLCSASYFSFANNQPLWFIAKLLFLIEDLPDYINLEPCLLGLESTASYIQLKRSWLKADPNQLVENKWMDWNWPSFWKMRKFSKDHFSRPLKSFRVVEDNSLKWFSSFPPYYGFFSPSLEINENWDLSVTNQTLSCHKIMMLIDYIISILKYHTALTWNTDTICFCRHAFPISTPWHLHV